MPNLYHVTLSDEYDHKLGFLVRDRSPEEAVHNLTPRLCRNTTDATIWADVFGYEEGEVFRMEETPEQLMPFSVNHYCLRNKPGGWELSVVPK